MEWKKIQDLKRQCYLPIDDRNDDTEYDMEKFAELIIRECICSIESYMSAYPNAYSTYQEGILRGMEESIRLIENKSFWIE